MIYYIISIKVIKTFFVVFHVFGSWITFHFPTIYLSKKWQKKKKRKKEKKKKKKELNTSSAQLVLYVSSYFLRTFWVGHNSTH